MTRLTKEDLAEIREEICTCTYDGTFNERLIDSLDAAEAEVEQLRAALLRLHTLLDFDETSPDGTVAWEFEDTSEINAAFKQAYDALYGDVPTADL